MLTIEYPRFHHKLENSIEYMEVQLRYVMNISMLMVKWDGINFANCQK